MCRQAYYESLSFRLFIHIPRRTVKLLLYIAVGLFVLFMALTRTQVGRDGLRAQLEAQFDAEFAGALKIGRLQGNLLNTLYAEQVQVLDSSGAVIVSMDGAVLEPSWLDLLSRTVSLSRITLLQPAVHLVINEDESTNLANALQRAGNGPAGTPWDFTSSEVKVIDGVVSTRKEGNLPERVKSGDVFDYSNATFRKIEARMNVEWRSDLKLLDIDHLSLNFENEKIDISDLHGQLVWERDRVQLNEFYLALGGTQLYLAGFLDQLSSLNSAPANVKVDLDIRESLVDHDGLRKLFPRHPLADTMQVSSRIQGALDALRVEYVRVVRNDLALEVSGVVRGFPDSLDYALSLANSTLDLNDISLLAPAVKWPAVSPNHSMTIRSLDTRGVIPLQPNGLNEAFYGEALFEVASEWGALQGNLEVRRPWKDSVATFHGLVQIDTLKLEEVIPDAGLITDLTGKLALQGEGDRFDEMVADLSLGLSSSMFQGHPIDTLDVYLYAQGALIAFDAWADHPMYGVASSDGVLFLGQEQMDLEADLQLEGFNVGAFLASDSLSTEFNGLVEARLSGSTLEDVRGEIAFGLDSSSVQRGMQLILLSPQSVSIALQDVTPDLQELRIEGDPIALTAKSAWNPDVLFGLASLWNTALRDAIVDISNLKPLEETTADPVTAALHENAHRVFIEQEIGGDVKIDLTYDVRDVTLINTLLFEGPGISTRARGGMNIVASPDLLQVSGRINADSVRVNAMQFEGFDGRFEMEAEYGLAAESMLNGRLNVVADSFQMAGQVVPSPTLAFNPARSKRRFFILYEEHIACGCATACWAI